MQLKLPLGCLGNNASVVTEFTAIIVKYVTVVVNCLVVHERCPLHRMLLHPVIDRVELVRLLGHERKLFGRGRGTDGIED